MLVIGAAKQLAEALTIARLGVHWRSRASARLGECPLREAVLPNRRGYGW